MGRYCTQCGEQLDPGANFCLECGAPFKGDTVNFGLPPKTEGFPEPEKFSTSPPEVSASVFEPVSTDFSQEIQIASAEDFPAAQDAFTVQSGSEFEAETESAPRLPLTAGKRALIAVASVLLSIVLFAAITAGQSLVVLRNSINNQTVKAMANAVLNEIDLAAFPVYGFVEADKVSLPDNINIEEGVELHEVIYSSIDEYYTQTFDFGEDHIKDLLEHRRFRDFLGEVLEGGVDYVMGGDDGRIVESDKIVELIEANTDEIERITSYRLVDTDFEDIAQILRDSGIDNLTWGSVINDVGGDAALIRGARNAFSLFERFSLVMLIVLSVVAVGVTVLLIVLNRHRVRNALLYFGIPCMVSGGAAIAGSFLLRLFFRYIADLLGLASAEVIRSAFSETSGIIMLCGLIVFAVGAVCVGLRTAVKRTKSVGGRLKESQAE